MAKYGDILEVLKDEIRLIRRGRLAPAKLSLAFERSLLTDPEGNPLGSQGESSPLRELPVSLPDSEASLACILVGDTGDLIELLGDEPEFGEVTELCARAVAGQLENRRRSA